MRIGQGYDVHAFCEGRDLYLCGEKIEYKKGMKKEKEKLLRENSLYLSSDTRLDLLDS